MTDSDFGDGPFAWMAHIACKDLDPDIFFPNEASRLATLQAAEAAVICAGCPVQPQCREHKRHTGAAMGVWGEEYTNTKGKHTSLKGRR